MYEHAQAHTRARADAHMYMHMHIAMHMHTHTCTGDHTRANACAWTRTRASTHRADDDGPAAAVRRAGAAVPGCRRVMMIVVRGRARDAHARNAVGVRADHSRRGEQAGARLERGVHAAEAHDEVRHDFHGGVLDDVGRGERRETALHIILIEYI